MNGEDNRDGMGENYSDNYGVEGETIDPVIEAVRVRQIKNFLLTLFVSRGVPMLFGGDEFRRTQQGNNNAYCQDNEISWYDWAFLDRHREVYQFVRGMIAFRRAHAVLSRETFYTDLNIRFFNPAGETPDWLNPQKKRLGCLILGEDESDLCMLFNAGARAETFALPATPQGSRWQLAVDRSITWMGCQWPTRVQASQSEPLCCA